MNLDLVLDQVLFVYYQLPLEDRLATKTPFTVTSRLCKDYRDKIFSQEVLLLACSLKAMSA